MKVIAFYLPQFHCIPENDEWWGKGFTEWVNVKKAKKLFPGHNQPRIPLNRNYYNLLDDDVKKWQVSIAKEHGIYGFCFYHYWFGGKLLLEKPVEQFLQNTNLDIHFCISWANEHWTNAWKSNGNTKVLIEQRYGNEVEWINHFNYLLPFFKDSRYIIHNNRPLFIIYRPELIFRLKDMLVLWNRLAQENGFYGIDFAYQTAGYTLSTRCDESLFAYAIEYQPNAARVFSNNRKLATVDILKKSLLTFVENYFKLDLRQAKRRFQKLEHFDYRALWEYIVNMKPRNEKCIPGAFVDWDNTSRRGKTGLVADGVSPAVFEQYMIKQIINAKTNYKKDMIFIFSWNEWAEGGYLEPDEKYGYEYLKAIKNALIECGEMPEF